MTDSDYKFTDGSTQRGYDWHELHPVLMDLEDDTFTFRVTRTEDDGLSFSAEAIEGLGRGTMTFILARCHAYWQEHGHAAQRLELTLSIKLSDLADLAD